MNRATGEQSRISAEKRQHRRRRRQSLAMQRAIRPAKRPAERYDPPESSATRSDRSELELKLKFEFESEFDRIGSLRAARFGASRAKSLAAAMRHYAPLSAFGFRRPVRLAGGFFALQIKELENYPRKRRSFFALLLCKSLAEELCSDSWSFLVLCSERLASTFKLRQQQQPPRRGARNFIIKLDERH